MISFQNDLSFFICAPVPNFVFSSLLKLSGFSSMPFITVEIFLTLPLICFDIIILADSLSNSFIISIKEFSSYRFDTNTNNAIQAEKTYGYRMILMSVLAYLINWPVNRP
jgi:hypothetical protein